MTPYCPDCEVEGVWKDDKNICLKCGKLLATRGTAFHVKAPRKHRRKK